MNTIDRFQPFTYIGDPDSRIQHAIRNIKASYGDIVYVKPKQLIKFGTNPNLGTSFETVWFLGGSETYQTTNAINRIESDNAGDNQLVTIEGHTVDGSGNYTFVTQQATLDGTNDVALTTPMARASRLFNASSTDFSGAVTVSASGVTNHLSSDGTNNQSLKCATTISQFDYWIVTGVRVGVTRNASQTRRVDYRFQVREKGGVFRTRETFQCTTEQGQVFVPMDPCLIVPKNADFKMEAVSSGGSTSVQSTVYGYLATSDLNQLD